jgi:hypothetical protein
MAVWAGRGKRLGKYCRNMGFFVPARLLSARGWIVTGIYLESTPTERCRNIF